MSNSTWQADVGHPMADGSHVGALWVRRGTLLILLALVCAALTSWVGVHTSTATASRGGYTLSLRYPAVARAGLDIEWQATITHAGGFGKEITLGVTGDYFDIFETQGFHPDPASETRNANTLYLTFTAPRGDTFVVYYDAYIQPASQEGKSAQISVIDGGSPVVSLDYRTRLFP